jgi:hypothetical protein
MGPCRDGPQTGRVHDIPLRNGADNPKFGPVRLNSSRSSRRCPEKLGNPKGCAAFAVFIYLPALTVLRTFPKPVPAMCHCFGPFRLVAQRRAGHAMEIGFLLQTTGVGIDLARAAQQFRHIQVADRRNHGQTPEIYPEPSSGLLGSRMQQQRDRQPRGAGLQMVDDSTKLPRLIGIFGAMDGRHHVIYISQDAGSLVGLLSGEDGCIEHDVSDMMHALGDALVRQIFDCISCRT